MGTAFLSCARSEVTSGEKGRHRRCGTTIGSYGPLRSGDRPSSGAHVPARHDGDRRENGELFFTKDNSQNGGADPGWS